MKAESLDKLIAIAHHAMLFEKWLRENAGHNDEWPVEIMADEKEGVEMAAMLKSLGDASAEVRADGEAMRALMAWQIKNFGSPYENCDNVI